MFKDLPQCVPQGVCLSCDGCCRFDKRTSAWRPKIGADELYGQWAENRKSMYQDDIYRHMLEENAQVHKVILTHWRQLGLIGRVVEVGRRIAAYTFGYPMGENIFCVMLEIADITIKGLPVYIFRKFCCDQQVEQFNFINTMDDCCLPNMAEVKLSFNPTIMNPSYTIRLR